MTLARSPPLAAPAPTTWTRPGATLGILLLVAILTASYCAGPASGSAPASGVPFPTAALPPALVGPSGLSCAQLHETRSACLAGVLPRAGVASAPALPHLPASLANWYSMCNPCSPTGRIGMAATYDAADGYVVAFGGYGTGGSLSDTWTFKAGVWTQLNPSTVPPARYDAAMAYDSTDGYVIMFGGIGANGYLSDTWEFLGGVWTQLYPTNVPPARFSPGLANDPADGYVVLFGGQGNSSTLSDTWTFAGGQWTAQSPSNYPSARTNLGMAWDPTDHYVLLFGGWSSAGAGLGDTWSYLAGTWTLLNPSTSPGARSVSNGQMVDDSTAGEVVLFSGYDPSSASWLTDTWSYVLGNWTQQSPSTLPSPRGWGTMSDDPTDQGALAFFGEDGFGTYLDDTWNWSMPAAVLSTSLSATPTAVDVNVPVSFVITGSSGTPPYSYDIQYGDGGSSTSASTTHTYTKAGTYTVWAWVNDSASGHSWATATVTVNPALSATATATPTPTDVSVPVAFTGAASGGTLPYGFLWRYGDGGSSGAQDPTHAYNATGTYTARYWLNDSGGGAALAQVSITVNALPTVTATASPGSTDAGTAIAFSAVGTGGTGTITYAWAFGDGGTATGASPSHTFLARGNYTVWVWANDSVGGSGSTTSVVHISPGLSTPTITATPSPTEAGVSVDFTASSWGGTSPVSQTWRFGDGGTGSGLSASHSFAASGTYVVSFWANDSAGDDTHATTTVVVNPAPTISSFSGNFATGAGNALDKGQSVTFTTTVVGGTDPLTYLYVGLPTGCSTANAGHVTCTPSAVGVFHLNVTVTDALGGKAIAPLSVFVNPPLALPSLTLSATSLDVSVGLQITVTTSGGTAPVTFDYLKLPSGCSSADEASLGCYPGAPGTVALEVQAIDATGASAFKNSSVVVNPLPTITSFTASPGNLTVGQVVSFALVAVPGTGSLTYSYAQFPTGCSDESFSGTTGSCTPSGAGTFHVVATVTDADGRSANATVVVQVTTVPSPLSITGGGSNSLWLWLILVVIAVAVIVALVVYRHRKKKNEELEAGGAGPAVAGGTGAAGGVAYAGQGQGGGEVAPAAGAGYGQPYTSDGYPAEAPAQAPWSDPNAAQGGPPSYDPNASPGGYPPQTAPPVPQGYPPQNWQAPQGPPPEGSYSGSGAPPSWPEPTSPYAAQSAPPPVTEAPPYPASSGPAVAPPAPYGASPPPNVPSAPPQPPYSAPPAQPTGFPAPPPGPQGSCMLCGHPLDPSLRCSFCGFQASP